MSIERLDGLLLSNILENGYRNLRRNMSVIDELNVFPVPDGDTGKNMTMTIEGGVLKAKPAMQHAGHTMQQIAQGTLLSARGNSGVILSQFIRGLANGMADKEQLTTADFIRALRCGVDKAYDAVVNPVEGTMLTVMREGTQAVENMHFPSFDELIAQLIRAMKKSLRNTPELLPMLKDAGVVDSGGAGLVCIFEGIGLALSDEWIEEDAAPIAAYDSSILTDFDPESLLEYGYCTEFVLQLQPSKVDLSKFVIEDMIAHLSTLGSSIVAVQEQALVKVHIHAFEPEKVIAYARTLGEFLTIKMENMSVQHNETMAQKKDKLKYAVVATASGQGIIDYFQKIGANIVIDGGQTNNPSAQDFVCAFEKLYAEHIIVLPNDSNIIMAAKQAAQIYTQADVRVVETKSIAEGYSALSMLDLSFDTVDEVIDEMTAFLPHVTTAYVTTATRDAFIDGVSVTKDHYIGLTPKHIYCDSTDPVDAAQQLFAHLPNMDEKQVLIVFVGRGITDDQTQQIMKILENRYPLLEIGVIDGQQDVYQFIFDIE